MLVHDFTSSKVTVVEMYYAARFVADGTSGLYDEALISFQGRHLRTDPNDFFLVGYLSIRPVRILVHLLQLVSPGECNVNFDQVSRRANEVHTVV